MKKFLIILFVLLVLPLCVLVHYFFPRSMEIYVVDTQNKLVGTAQQMSAAAKGQASGDLDLMMIQTVSPDDRREPHVFRNEDAWWVLKFDSYNLQTQAADAARATPPRLMRIRYYGWRIAILSMLPNAISMQPAQP